MSDELQKKILDYMESKKAKKKKFYPKDLVKALPDENRREVKKAIQALTMTQELEYWSSGSTTYVMLKECFDEIGKEGSDLI